MAEKNRYTRLAKGYRGNDRTNREIRDLLPDYLSRLNTVQGRRPDLLLAAWPEIIGGRLAPMTKAVSFEEGILLVKVANSSLYSLLQQHEKKKLLQILKERFPGIEIKNIVFRLG